MSFPVSLNLSDELEKRDKMRGLQSILSFFFATSLFDLILYIPSTIFQLYRDMSSWVEPVLS